ncbi:venom serine carboxypeptidase-like [Rhipicephalus microplus]|uniref:venom serine carboxypeptidase-like n=1 Tax=Rhipicephalus microplus TaxID=6941 RepID=UPI0018877A53|nr:venom serine carboxypeptidase-like [Rhipicephalus microplus]
MTWPHIRILIILAVCLQYIKGADTNGETEQTNSDSPVPPERSLPEQKPLLLTPLIMNCSYDEAREKSQVELFRNMGINAHSGYITVNETINLFFVLVEGAKNDSSEPLLLWTQGGPGLSALFGLFLENGPVAINESGNLSPRNNTLQKNMSVLYVDLPVGAGFSFTTHNDSYAKSLNDIVFSVMEFLKQFLQLFGYYRNRPFYLGGESYGARYSVAVANRMLSHPEDVSLSLKGVISGSGFLGPVLEIAESSRFLYEMSMVDETGRGRFKQEFETMKLLAANQSTALGAVLMLGATIFTSSESPTLFQELTLFNDHASPLFTERPGIMYACVVVLNSTYMRQALHVGGVPFQFNNPLLLSNLAPDWLVEINAMVEKVLNESSLLSYIGQLDTLFPAVNQKAYFAKLNWTHADTYRNTSHQLWRKPDRYYGHDGYIKKVAHLTEAVLLGMSHYSSAEKPDEVYYLITEFAANSSNTAKVGVMIENARVQ